MKRIPRASLKHLNSFAVEASAGQLLQLESEDDLNTLTAMYRFDPARDLILGGGSNVLLIGDIKGTVLMNGVKGKKIIEDSDDEVLLEVCAGENWHELVLWSIDQGLSGIENLSLIPGLAGAAPMQNIGAYGVELADVFDSLQALDLYDGGFREFSHDECQFSYRDSRFKSTDAERYLITRIRLRLQRSFVARLNYAGINEELQAMNIEEPSVKQVSEAVIRIRQRKLHDPGVMGNAGSFFKNPVIDRSVASLLKKDFGDLPVYRADGDKAKLSAGWLIEQCGWKGRSMGGAAVSDKHALILVNKENATGKELLILADTIRESVRCQFGIELQTEPRIVGA